MTARMFSISILRADEVVERGGEPLGRTDFERRDGAPTRQRLDSA